MIPELKNTHYNQPQPPLTAYGYTLNHSKNLQQLIETVAEETALPEKQAAAAVTATLQYLTARLPSPTVGKLFELLETEPGEPQATVPSQSDHK